MNKQETKESSNSPIKKNALTKYYYLYKLTKSLQLNTYYYMRRSRIIFGLVCQFFLSIKILPKEALRRKNRTSNEKSFVLKFYMEQNESFEFAIVFSCWFSHSLRSYSHLFTYELILRVSSAVIRFCNIAWSCCRAQYFNAFR